MDEKTARTTPVSPDYAFPDATLVLLSSDGMAFKVHTIVLQLGSKFFETMTSLPQKGPVDAENSEDNAIHLAEDKELLKALLDIIYPGRHPSDIASSSFATQLAAAGEKYDMPDVAAFIRNEISKSTFPGSALDAYVLACRFGWMEEARTVSSRTLNVDLRSDTSRQLLKQLDGSSLLKLLDLHRRRRELVLEALNLEYNTPSLEVQAGRKLSWPALTPAHSAKGCQYFEHNKTFWTALKYYVSEELEVNALGDTLRDPAFWNSAKVAPLWADVCNQSCRLAFFKKRGLISEFCRIIDVLPKCIEI
ncbi:hypothetical protein M0805_000071 [Coniferiporia weirii]|nr:hypothetical protein M0805_000071 [Coniferiporia weirii]